MTPYCTLDYTGQLATIEFGSPHHNALPVYILEQLSTHLNLIKQAQDIKIILIKSHGDRSFCAGADLNELINIPDEAEGKKFFFHFARILLAIRSSPQIVITRVQGKAIGGALGLIAASDLSYATDQATIRLSELVNGIGPFVVGPAIQRKMGVSFLNHMALHPAIWFNASWAMDKGLYNEVFHVAEAMDERIADKINELQLYSQKALIELKKMMWSGTPDWYDLLEERATVSGKLVMTEESKEAMKRLLVKPKI